MKKPVYVRMDEDVLDYVDSFAEKNGISRAGAISVIVGLYRQSVEGIDSVKKLVLAYEAEKAKDKSGTGE
jgi:hypothetical protein